MRGSLDEIVAWLIAPGTVCGPVELFDELARRLSDTCVPLLRASASLMTKHPEVYGKQLIWTRAGGARAVLRPHAVMESAMYLQSPAAYVRRERQALIARLDAPPADLEYDLYRELAAEGATGYVCFPMPFRAGLCSFVSFATDRPGGFDAADEQLLEALIPALSLRWELESASYSLEALLSTYLGDNAAKRVLGGEFKRRTGQTMNAVIWTADLREFTALVNQRPVDDVLRTLDEYFHCVAAPIASRGGEVLKFIGDAVLAVFPTDGADTRAACQSALRAMSDSRAALETVNEQRTARGDRSLAFGLALHIGEVVYGNIGVEGRLDFTVIGHAVNVASRVEGLTKQLGHPVLLTADFVAAAGLEDARSAGQHVIPGLDAPLELFVGATGGRESR